MSSRLTVCRAGSGAPNPREGPRTVGALAYAVRVSTPIAEHSALRGVFGGVRGAAAGALAVAAHALAGGGIPDTALMVLLVGMLGWVTSASAKRAGGLLGVSLILGIGQLLAHAVLSVPSSHHAVMLAAHHHGGGSAGDTATMTLTHAVATAVTAVLVVRAEDTLRTIVAGLRTLLRVVWLSPPPASGGTHRLRVATSAPPSLLPVLLHCSCRPRGPPSDS